VKPAKPLSNGHPSVASRHLFDPTLSSDQKAVYHYLRGHLYNVLPTYIPEAEENLSKAVKLNPRLADAWNALGACLHKRGDLEGAKRCFEGGIEHVRFFHY
jgi:lipoprotein NlpI